MQLCKRSQTVISQEKVEALFWLLQHDGRTPGSSLRALQSVKLVHVRSYSCIMHDYSVFCKQWQFS